MYALPGVPALFRDLINALVPTLGGPPLHREELTSHRREGEIAETLSSLQGLANDVMIGSYPVFEGGTWHVRVVLRGQDADRVSAVATEVRAHL